jgi:hypothetical protein
MFATKNGYVETIPDKTVDPTRGYPILCSRTEYGRVLPTVPLNYHTQSTAMYWMSKAMVRCQEELDEWNKDGYDARMVMQIHDELVFDLPKRREPWVDAENEKKPGAHFRTSNLWRIRTLQKLMSKGGDDIGVPTPVAAEYHASNWSEGVQL